MLKGLNHITLAVSDLNTSVDFYQKVLGMELHAKWNTGAYFKCGELWLCLSFDNNRSCINAEMNDYTHYSFSIDEEDFEYFQSILKSENVSIWKVNSSEGKSFYFLDPDGHKLEIHVGGLAERLKACKQEPYDGMIIYPKPITEAL